MFNENVNHQHRRPLMSIVYVAGHLERVKEGKDTDRSERSNIGIFNYTSRPCTIFANWLATLSSKCWDLFDKQ